jgi:SAM-dependent MidA family methyltransferase
VFRVVEVGAGPGTLAATVLAAEPACRAALRYVLVDSSPAQRAGQAERLALTDPHVAFASAPEPDDDAPAVELPAGPIVVSLADWPRLPTPCVVLANELLDNLPVDLAERTRSGWAEVRVGLEGDDLAEVLVPGLGEVTRRAEALAPAAAVGAQIPVADHGARWVRAAREVAGRGGRVVAVDYGDTTASLAARPVREWLRTYRDHQRGGPPLLDLGTQDITCEVPVDQLPTPADDRSQADWLTAHGIEALVAEGRRGWQERAAVGDLAAVRARSRVTEAEALLDPSGLGGFRVLVWVP